MTLRTRLFAATFFAATLLPASSHAASEIVPAAPLPFEVEGDDISATVEAYTTSIRERDLMVNQDGEFRLAARSLLNPLLVPSRLKANEEFMHRFADEMVREMVAKGTCEKLVDGSLQPKKA